ncbi:MAG: adenylate/guanylate cyclase domain-containing protein [Polyangiales bacterium]
MTEFLRDDSAIDRVTSLGPPPPMERFTGRFADGSLEREIVAESSEESRRFVRFAFVLASVVFLAYGIHDAIVIPEVHTTAWAIRYAVFGPVAVAAILATWAKSFPRIHQWVALAFGLAANVVVLAIGAISPPTGFFLYTGYAILFVTIGPFIARMNVPTQVLYTLLTIALYCVVDRHRLHGNVVFFSINMTLLSMGTIGALAAFQIEAQGRKSFLQRRLIDAQMEALTAEQRKSEALLLNILPARIAQRLKNETSAIAEGCSDVSVLFSDIVGFTKLSQQVTPEELVRRLNVVFTRFDDLAEELGLEKIKTIGDAYMVVGGLEGRRGDHARKIAEMALGMQKAIREVDASLGIRVGIHTGPVVAGVIGKKKFSYDVWGDTVNTASRMESHGVPGEIHVTEETKLRLEDHFAFECRGELEIKGKGPMTTYLLRPRA